jgi:predicted membrane chloride channel (bestrophin family)
MIAVRPTEISDLTADGAIVTGLLLSYRFSSAMSKWDEGKKVWVDVRTTIRDGIRMVRQRCDVLNLPPW